MSSKNLKKPAGRIPAKQVASLVDNMVLQGAMPPLSPKSPADIDAGMNTSVIRLKVRDVRPYERNPRTATNERITEICESIRTRGLDQMFALTKRPGETHYITAKGGCTRLASLQRLAEEEPARFEYADFLVVPYKSESDLLAGHLVENIQREGMSFWDTAQGILGMQTALELEFGRELSSRDFEEQLKLQGLETSRLILSDYRFLHAYLIGIHADFRMAIGRNDIRYQLRPFFGLAEALWGKHPGLPVFDQEFAGWVSSYQDVDGYSADRMIEHLQSQLALRLDYSRDQVISMLAVLKLKKEASLDELLSPSESRAEVLIQSHEDAAEHSGEDAQQPTGANVLSPSNLTGGALSGNDLGTTPEPVTASTPSSQDTDRAPQPQAPAPAPSFGGVPGASGLMVASGLTPNPKTRPGNPEPNTAAAQQHLGLSAGGFATQSDSPASLLELVRECAESVGIASYVVQASMPFGFFMEIPPAGALGVDAADLAVQGWWILANLSGQLRADLDLVLQSLDAQGELMLPDTGPDGFRACLEDEDRWREAVVERLGGQTLLDSELVIQAVTSGTHPMADFLVEILAAMRANSRADQGGLL